MLLMLSLVGGLLLNPGNLDLAASRARAAAQEANTALDWKDSPSPQVAPTFTGSESVGDGVAAWFVYPISKETSITQDARRLKVEKAVLAHKAAEQRNSIEGRFVDEIALMGRIGPGMRFMDGIEGDVGWTAGYAPSSSTAVFAAEGTVGPSLETASADEILLAVLPFKTVDTNLDQGVGSSIAMLMITEIDAPNVTVLEREEVGRIVEAKSFAQLDVTEDGDGLAIGELLNARYLLMGTVGRMGDETLVMTGRIIDAGTGEIVDGHRGAVVGSYASLADNVRMLAVKMGLRSPAGMKPSPILLQSQAEPGTVESMVRVVSRNDAGALELTAAPSQPIYLEGQSVRFQLKSDKAGYLTMFAIGSTGDVTLLAPNRELRSVMLDGGETFEIPTENMPFQFKIKPPYGLTRIKAFLTPEPVITPGSFDDQRALMLKLVRESNIASDGRDPLANRNWSCREISFMTGPALKAP
ncbi:MAG: hypothetical protein CMJ40_09240 [Phycisphaerae bacterium]|nr:hypothetical protein [Phycisphaerae bacterium]